jgi:hypothetical protein
MKTKILSVFIIVFIGALVLEGGTRLFLSPNKGDTVPREIGQFDKMLGWSLKPLSRGISSRTGNEVEYRINSKGLRDDETSYEKSEGIFRIVLLGDSNAFGFGVPIEKHFSTLLEGYFKNVEVINMGVNGFGVDQELIYLRSEGFRYQPDLVLAYVPHYGDHRHMHTRRWGQEKPRFKIINGELVLTNSPVSNSPSPSTNPLQRIDHWFRGHSRSYEIFRNAITRLISQEQRETPVSQEQQDEKNIENEAFRKELNELGAAIVYAMHKESSEHGATFVLVTKMGELHEACLKRNILSLDVSGPLSNHKFSLPDNLGHINESGNGVLAWEIAKFLQTNHLIPIKYLNT